MKRIGIMGGTFNPIHNAHLTMASSAYKQAGLDQIWFMPSKNPPHKCSSEIVSEDHRSNMIKQAIRNVPFFHFSDFELCHEGITYTAETLQRLQKTYPEYQFYFLMGGDSLFELETWYQPEKIMQMVTILAFARNGETFGQMRARAGYLTKQYHADIHILSMPPMPVSSSMIRKKLRTGQSVHDLLPENVEKYIFEQHLYL